MHFKITQHQGVPYDIQIMQKAGDKKNVGYFLISVYQNGDLPQPGAVIYYMYLRPKYRGKGYGKLTIDDFKKRFSELKTGVGASSDESIKFLKRQGFKDINGWLVWKDGTEDDIAKINAGSVPESP